MFRRLILIAMLALMTACAALQSAAPQDPTQTVAAVVSGATAARESATTLLAFRKITVADFDNVRDHADTLRRGADVARAMLATNPDAAKDKVALLQASLRELNRYLLLRQAALAPPAPAASTPQGAPK